MADAMVNKLLHGPIQELKAEVERDDSSTLLELVRRLFRLEMTQTPDTPGGASETGGDAKVVHIDSTPEKERESA